MQTRPHCLVEHLEPRQLLASATINWNDVRQTIDGFGASSAWTWGTISQTALDQFFSPTSGAGLSLLRSHIYPQGWSSENGVMQQVAPYGVTVWSTPWSPPREWKTNHDNNNGGSLDPAHYQDYADLLATYILDMKAQGVPLYAISLQNEPNWTASYESCRWDAQQFADFLPYVGQTFAARGITTRIMLPETLNWSSISSFAATVMSSPALAQYVGILAGHNYGETAGSYQPVSNANGKTVWETEVTLSSGSTQIANAIDLGDDIHQALADANANAYHYWWLNSSSTDQLMTNWVPNKRLWALGQYSRFVRPGWVRIGETDDGGLDITTFKDPASGKFAIVVVNKNTSGSITEQFTLNGVSAASVTPYITSSTDDLKQYSSITLTGGTSFSATIAANSIVTYVGVSSAAAPLQAPGNLKAAPPYAGPGSQIALAWSDNSSSETGYTLERSTNGTTWTVVTSTLAANTTSYTDTGRAENTLYYYRVKPTNGDSTTYSAVASASTVLAAPGPWWNVTATRVAGGIQLGWPQGSAATTGVSIDRSLDGLTWSNVAILPTRATSYTDTIPGYNANQFYSYRIRYTAGTTYSAYTGCNTGLATPTSFTATQVRSSSITFSWISPTIGASGAWIEQYNASTSTWSTVSPSSLQATDGTWTLRGLSANTAYTFRMRVSSVSDSINSGYTANLNVTTPAPSVSPIAWYKADEGAGTTLADASGNGNAAALTGSCSFSSGVSGNALNLAGGYAGLPSGITSSLGSFTIATWIKAASISNWARVFDFGTSTSNYMFLTVKSGSTNLPRFAINTGSGEQAINSSIAIAANAWTHVAVTLAGSTATLYINGVAAGTNTGMTLQPAALGVTTRNYLGKSQFTADPAFLGSLDDFRIYERALSAVEVSALATPALPTGWAHADVGAPALAGGTIYNSTTELWTIAGSGSDIWNSSDQFHYAYRSASGDFAIVARVTDVTNTNAWAKAGVMIRDGLGANAAYAFMTVRPDNQAAFQWRSATGAAAQGTALLGGTGVKYLKLERTAGMVTGYYSDDGITWSAAGPATAISMPDAISAGLAVSSHDTAQICSATFSNVQLLPAATVTDFAVNGGAVQRSRVTSLSVRFSSPVTPGTDAFSVVRRSDGQSFAVVAGNPAADRMNYVLTFTGAGVEYTSLPDGVYDITIRAASVPDPLGQTLSGGNRTFTFHRLFGDSDGNRIVNSLDYARLKQTFGRAPTDPLFNSAFDFDGNSLINALDLARFRQRYGMSYSY